MALGAVAFAEGGYFPRTWGWATLLFLAIAGVSFAAGRAVVATRLEAALVAGLAGLAGWMLLSAVWSESAWRAPLEAQRAVLYAAGAAALLAVTVPRSARLLPWSVLLAVAAASAYGLAGRLFPERFGHFDPIAGYRLAEPLGYWNGLGAFAAMGAILAVGAVALGHPLARAAAGALVPLLAATVYFTFSRGAWIVLAIGLLVAIAVSSRRLSTVTAALVLAPFAGVAVLLASRASALTDIRAELDAASSEGRRLALILLGLSLASAVAAGVLGVLADRVRPGSRARSAYGGALLAAGGTAVVAAVVALGGPVGSVERAWDAFRAPPPRVESDLNVRLRSFSGTGRVTHWRVALDNYRAHPVVGSGAGTYERAWLRDERATFKVRDAHGLYFEVLSELGPIGLGLLGLALAAPLAAVPRVRQLGFVGPAVGAYAAFLVHAGIDWDWELPALTLAALTLAVALLVAARDRRPARLRPSARTASTAAVAVLCGLVTVSLLGNRALSEGQQALSEGDALRAADEARTAAAFAPWSPQPLTLLAEAQLAAGYPDVARETAREAIALDAGEWRPWYVLALASRGEARTAAFEEVLRLNRTVRIPAEEAAG